MAKIQIIQCPATTKNIYKIPEKFIFDNVDILPTANEISPVYLNFAGLTMPSLYLRWDVPNLCTSMDVHLLAYDDTGNLVQDDTYLSGINPALLPNGGMIMSIWQIPYYTATRNKIQVVNSDAVNTLTGLSAYLLGVDFFYKVRQ